MIRDERVIISSLTNCLHGDMLTHNNRQHLENGWIGRIKVILHTFIKIQEWIMTLHLIFNGQSHILEIEPYKYLELVFARLVLAKSSVA